MNATSPPLKSLFRHVWRAYSRAALLPLMLVELALIGAYLVTHGLVRDANITSVRRVADDELVRIAAREASGVNGQLQAVARLTDLFRRRSLDAYQTPHDPGPEEKARYAYAPSGVWHTIRDTGGAAGFYSGIVPIGEKERKKAWQLAQLDGLMGDLVRTEPLVGQVYINTHDSFNRIYPYFDTLAQYPARMDIPAYNFYYLADAQHNPERKVVWTGVYIDPAGQGWMTSAIAPVYLGDRLEAVVGIDLTVKRVLDHVLNLAIPWGGYALLLDGDGVIMAMPPVAETDWGLRELTDHSYTEAILQDTFKPDAFNLFKNPALSSLAQQLRAHATGLERVNLTGSSRLTGWARIPETGWTLLVLAPEDNIYAEANTLAARFQHIGLGMIMALVLFYLMFFAFLYRRAQAMSHSISQPLEYMDQMVQRIGEGAYRQQVPRFEVRELQHTAEQLVAMGDRLDESQRALQDQASFLQALIDTIPLPIYYTDLQGGFLGCNKPFERFFGHLTEELRGRPASEVLPQPEGAMPLELGTRDYSGTARDILLQTAHPDPATAQGVGSIGVLLDITERKQAERSIAEARDRAEEASRLKSQFLSSMSHELRTPMNAILGFSQLLESDPSQPLTEDQRDSVAEIGKAGRHLLQLINEVLDLARIESGRMEVFIEQVEVAPLVSECLSLVGPLAERHDIRLEAVAAGCGPTRVLADYTRLKQVLLNLLSNAIKYNRPQGWVTVRCLAGQGDSLRLEVEDSGRGLTPQEQLDAFEPFRRLDKESVEGTGIGLTISKQLMDLMGGNIGVTSTSGIGSRFWLDLPQVAPAASPSLLEDTLTLAQAPSVEAARFTLLYVEDNPANLRLLQRLLGRRPEIRLLDAHRAELGLDLARAHRPDLILLDINLPGMDGYQALVELRQFPETAQIPVIAISANALPRDVQRGLEAGFREYLTKPLDVDRFMTAVDRALGLSEG